MKAIVNVDKNWGIGLNGSLLERIPEDMKFFKQNTVGKVVVMGRETFESMPGRSPLPDRINIVLSKRKDFEDDRVIICHSLQSLFEELSKYEEEDIFVIGGGIIYQELLPYCTQAYVTKNDKNHEADRYFPNLDKLPNWEQIFTGEMRIYNDMKFYFTKYENNSPRPYK